jgi:hypothetical protein
MVLKTVNCGNVITIIAVMVQRTYAIRLYLCASIASKIRVIDMSVVEKYGEYEGKTVSF